MRGAQNGFCTKRTYVESNLKGHLDLADVKIDGSHRFFSGVYFVHLQKIKMLLNWLGAGVNENEGNLYWYFVLLHDYVSHSLMD